ncbi:transmembrane protein 17B-like [Clavelina lepadiformis]|uniref:Transmembrane protein 17 n=1 Tax=Clavelina lepadiformis TaxID=159417 RepID=A0ABP0GRR9_CLALP
MSSKRTSTQVLSPQVRQVLSNLSYRLFSQDPSSYSDMKDSLPGNEIVTSLPLQMSLYFNAFFFPFWLTAAGLMLDIKYQYLADTYKVLLIAILVIFSVVEVIRVYLGYVGNLQEKVPEVAGFLLLTIMPQTPLILFLLFNENTIVLPLERAVHIVEAIFILIEIIFACRTAGAMTRQQATKFHLQQFVDLEQIPNQGGYNDYGADPNAPQIVHRNVPRS